MGKFTIIAESGADLSRELIERYNIHVAPMHVEINGTDYLDGSISIEELCGYYDKTGKVPKTAAASPYDYQQVYEKIRKDDPDSVIIHVCYSKVLSATFQNSLIANEGLDRIYHVDSLNVSIGQAFVVMKAAKFIEENPCATPEEIIERVKEYAAKVKFSFVPGNLDYLRAGGRVSNAQYLGASLLRLKPLIELIDGQMLSTKKYRGSSKNVLKQMIGEFFTKHDIDKDMIFLAHAGAVNDDIKNDIEKQVRELGVKEFVWIKAGGVITSHSGPGGIGITGIVKTV